MLLTTYCSFELVFALIQALSFIHPPDELVSSVHTAMIGFSMKAFITKIGHLLISRSLKMTKDYLLLRAMAVFQSK
jgi:hypothetical protein